MVLWGLIEKQSKKALSADQTGQSGVWNLSVVLIIIMDNYTYTTYTVITLV